MSVYLDASAIVPLFVPEPASDRMEEWLAGSEGPLHVGDLATGEIGSALSRLVRMGALSQADAAAIHADFLAWRDAVAIRVEHGTADVVRAAALVRIEHPKLLMPDAIHISTCARLGLQLVTIDERLVEAAGARGLEALNPAA